MAQAAALPTTAMPRAATVAEVIDMQTGEIMTPAEARRRALLRRVWTEHDMDGSARHA